MTFVSKSLRQKLLPIVAGASLAMSCYETLPVPLTRALGPAGGYAPDDFDVETACDAWEYNSGDDQAGVHYTYPELAPESCYVEVEYEPGTERIIGLGEIEPGCGYPRRDTRARLLSRAKVYERIAAGNVPAGAPIPLELACPLTDEVRRLSAAANARTLRSYAASISSKTHRYPYSLAGTFGYGALRQNESRIREFKPGMDCLSLTDNDRDILSVNNIRARRIAEAYRKGVAPLVSVSGAAVHSEIVEAFMLMHLASCDGGVPMDRILLDPCADHTHTNVRNTGALVHAIGGRTGYLLTDDFLQADYLGEYTGFELIGGGIDQRALRDFGYILGAWRRSSRNFRAGFWYTPYRFWAEPEDGLGSFTCAVDTPILAPAQEIGSK